MIADSATNYDSQTLSGTSEFTYLSRDRMGRGRGILEGTYYENEGYEYSLTDIGLGTYTETPLAFMSKVYLVTYGKGHGYQGQYAYPDGGYYSYHYRDNIWGYSSYYWPTLEWYPYTYHSYYDDRTTSTGGPIMMVEHLNGSHTMAHGILPPLISHLLQLYQKARVNHTLLPTIHTWVG